MVTEDAQFITTGENGLRKQTLKWSEVTNNLASRCQSPSMVVMVQKQKQKYNQ